MVTTRFAPSPTGRLHVGGLRTALFNYLWAKKNRGKFILRIEDTDRERYVEKAEEEIESILKQFGLLWDEKYKQSERLVVYQKYAKQLVEEGRAFEETTTKGTAIRFKMPKTGTTEWTDLVYKKLQFKNELIKDPIIIKSDGYPVYNFANVIDDHEMGITHVIRGEEFLSSTPIHLQLYRALSWEPPQFAHVPLILDETRKKLSKRTGDVAVEEYLKKGYLKEAIINFIALLGWNPKTTKEIFSLQELEAEFEIEKVNKAGAIFDLTKLDFLNRQWQKRLRLPAEKDPLFRRAAAILSANMQGAKISLERLTKIWPQLLERIPGPSSLEKYLPEFHFYFQKELTYQKDLLIWKNTSTERIKQNLMFLSDYLNGLQDSDFKQNILETKIKKVLAEQGIGTGEALWPLRVALSGQKNSPSPFEIMDVLGKQDSLARIQKAIQKLQ